MLVRNTLTTYSKGKGLPNAYGKDYKFSMDWFTPSIPIWRKALAPYVSKPDLQYLEIGVFEGRSLIWVAENVLTNPSSHFTVIDPFLDQFEDKNSNSEEYDKDWFAKKNVETTYYDNIRLCGIEDRVTTMKGFSQTEMEKLPIAAYDIIYIDGSHRTRDVLEDAILAMRRLKVGGIIIFDDYLWGGEKYSSPFPAINIFYALYEDELDVVHKGYQVIFTKKER